MGTDSDSDTSGAAQHRRAAATGKVTRTLAFHHSPTPPAPPFPGYYHPTWPHPRQEFRTRPSLGPSRPPSPPLASPTQSTLTTCGGTMSSDWLSLSSGSLHKMQRSSTSASPSLSLHRRRLSPTRQHKSERMIPPSTI